MRSHGSFATGNTSLCNWRFQPADNITPSFQKKRFFKFSSNSEANASELLEKLETDSSGWVMNKLLYRRLHDIYPAGSILKLRLFWLRTCSLHDSLWTIKTTFLKIIEMVWNFWKIFKKCFFTTTYIVIYVASPITYHSVARSRGLGYATVDC